MILFRQLVFGFIFLFTLNQSFAGVWVSTNSWNPDWEKKYSLWVKEDSEKLVIKNAGNKNRIPIAIVEGKKNIPKRKKIKP